MNRRDALSRVALILGGTVIGSNLFLQSGCKSNRVNNLFDEDQVALLDEIAETILPKTKTPGAKEANVGAFMSVMVKDCYSPLDQKIFLEGLKKIDDESKKLNGEKFMKSTPEQRTKLLVSLDKQSNDFNEVERKRVENDRSVFKPKTNLYEENNKIKANKHYFRMIKELTLLGYFTSEVGAKQALRYVEVPGSYNGNLPYKKGDRAWAL